MGCRMARVGPGDVSPRSACSDEGSDEGVGEGEGEAKNRKSRVVVQHLNDGACKFCPTKLNKFNRMEGGVCAACANVIYHQYEDQRKYSQSAIMENAGSVYRALDKAYRVNKFAKGLDQLRDLYFEKKVVQPWIDEERRLQNEALVDVDRKEG